MEPFVGEIAMFGGNFSPRGWAFCDGQLLPISSNEALFSLLGTFYGGDGRTTFALPDLRGRVALHAGSGPGLSQRRLGEKGGTESVALTEGQIPPHTHSMSGTTTIATLSDPTGEMLASSTGRVYRPIGSGNTYLSSSTIADTGGGQAHGNIMPFCCVNYIIALTGIYPSRS